MLSERSPEFLSAVDDVVERCLCRISGPTRDHFVNLAEKLPKLCRMTNLKGKQIVAGVRRLVRSGRMCRSTQRFGGRTVSGIIGLPRRDWERLREPQGNVLQLSPSDVEFLKGCGVQVAAQDVPEVVLAD